MATSNRLTATNYTDASAMLGRFAFGFASLFLFAIAMSTEAATVPWGPGVSAALAWGLFFLHVALVGRRVSPFDPVVWFVIAMLLFYFGRAILIDWFGMSLRDGHDPWGSGGGPWVAQGYLTSLLAVASTLAGIHLAGVRPMTRVDASAAANPAFELTSSLFAVGALTMVLAGIAIAGPSTVFGFYDQWYAAKLGNVDQRFIDMGVPFAQAAAVALIATTPESAKRRRWLAYLAFAFTCSVAIAKGDRTSVIAFGVSAGWVYTQRISRVRWATVAALALVAMLVMPLIAEYRVQRRVGSANAGNVPELVSRTVGEMGLSASAIVYTQKLVPERQGFLFGRTFVLAATEMIPNVTLSKSRSSLEVPLTWNPSYWLVWTLAPDYAASGGGFGFSMAAEWYYNFGLWGVWLGPILVGYGLTRARNSAGNSPLALVWSATLFAGLSIWVRNVVGYPMRVAIWPIVGLWLIYRAVTALAGRRRVRPNALGGGSGAQEARS